MRIFVTGGSGFIGKHLLPLLEGHDVLCLSHSTQLVDCRAVHTIVGDLNTPSTYIDQLERFNPECCIHLAWGGLPDYSLHNCSMNFSASVSLFEVLVRIGCRKIFVSGSCWEYGDRTGLVSENERSSHLNLFAAHKAALQLIGQSLCDAAGSQFVWGRLFFVYGPGQRTSSLIPSCYRSLRQEEPPQITNPLAVNDFIHVADVASAISMLVQNDDANGIYNIGSGRPVTVWSVANQLAEVMGLPPVYLDLPQATGGTWADVSKMEKLGWRHSMSLQSGIVQTVNAFNTQ